MGGLRGCGAREEPQCLHLGTTGRRRLSPPAEQSGADGRGAVHRAGLAAEAPGGSGRRRHQPPSRGPSSGRALSTHSVSPRDPRLRRRGCPRMGDRAPGGRQPGEPQTVPHRKKPPGWEQPGGAVGGPGAPAQGRAAPSPLRCCLCLVRNSWGRELCWGGPGWLSGPERSRRIVLLLLLLPGEPLSQPPGLSFVPGASPPQLGPPPVAAGRGNPRD